MCNVQFIDPCLSRQISEGGCQQSSVARQEACQGEHATEHDDKRSAGVGAHRGLAERQHDLEDIVLQDAASNDRHPGHA